jgi:hypothetical protein
LDQGLWRALGVTAASDAEDAASGAISPERLVRG